MPLGSFAAAVRNVGFAVEIVSEEDFEAAMTAHWVQSNVGPRQAAAKLRPACGNVEPLSKSTLEKLETRWRQDADAFGILLTLLAEWHRLTGFDCEDVESPADHTCIVHYLAETTGDKFSVEDIIQTTEPNNTLRLAFRHQSNSHSFTFRHIGSWINLSGTLDGLNRILEEIALQERYIELYNGGGQAGAVAFVLPNVFLPVARELHIRLESTPNVKYD